ncbi:GTPase [Geomonas sp. Red276]
MGFKAILKGIIDDCGGGLGAIVMGYDGISIDEYIKPSAGVDVQILAVEYASVIKEIKETVGVLKTGELQEVAILSDNCSVVVRGINNDFFLALVLAPDGNFGKARYLMKREAARLGEELQ